jgi:hypothetical protein
MVCTVTDTQAFKVATNGGSDRPGGTARAGTAPPCLHPAGNRGGLGEGHRDLHP